MTPRERILASIVVGVVLLAAGGFFFYQLFWIPLKDKEAQIQNMQKEVDDNQAKIAQAIKDKAQLERLKLLSLPPNVDLAQREYENYLTDLLIKSGFASSDFAVKGKKPDQRLLTAKKPPNFLPLTFTVECPGKLDNLVRMLEGFYRTGLLHEIKNLTIDQAQVAGPKQKPGDLTIKMTIEALIVNGAEPRKYLLPNVSPRVLAVELAAALRGAPTGLGWAGWAAGPSGPLGPERLATQSRRYAAIAEKNIFVGPVEVKKEEQINVAQFVYLTDITRDDKGVEGHLYNRFDNVETRLRAKPGLNLFFVKDNLGATLVSGRVVHMDNRELLFETNDKFYLMPIGISVAEAMKKPVPRGEVEAIINQGSKVTVRE